MDLSTGAAKFLIEAIFRPSRREARIDTATVVSVLDCTEDEAQDYLRELAREGLILRQDENPLYYRTTPSGCQASETMLRQRKRRRAVLMGQLLRPIKDLILALAYEGHATNARLKPGFWGTVTTFPLIDTRTILRDWPEHSVDNACSELIAAGLLADSGMLQGTRHVDLTRRGIKEYKSRIRVSLGLREQESILDPPPDGLQVFFAWQSEFKPARNILSEVVSAAIRQLNADDRLLRAITLVEATEPGEGALRIDVSLPEKIRDADYFIGDLTPVYSYGSRLRVNENVLIETGFALASKPESRIILLAMRGREVPGDGSVNPQPAFDIRHVRRLEFSDKPSIRKKLYTELGAMLTRDEWMAPLKQNVGL